jgi:hypothetical protein
MNKIEDDEFSMAHKRPTVISEEEMKAARGIIYGLVVCIPFWILFLKFVKW